VLLVALTAHKLGHADKIRFVRIFVRMPSIEPVSIGLNCSKPSFANPYLLGSTGFSV
jgi:hypothetical protein